MVWIYEHQISYPFEQNLFNIKGFKSYFSSNDTYRVGGVALFVRNNIQSFKIPSINISYFDCCLIELSFERSKVQIAAVYRSPTISVSNPENLTKDSIPFLISTLSKDADCLLVGDLNFCLRENNAFAETYSNGPASGGFLLLNDQLPTRITETMESLIDHIICRQHSAYGFVADVCESNVVSDHQLINVEFFPTQEN